MWEKMTVETKYSYVIKCLDPYNKKGVIELLDELYIILANQPSDEEIIKYTIGRLEGQLKENNEKITCY